MIFILKAVMYALLMLFTSVIFSQTTVIGVIEDADTKEPIPYANIGIYNKSVGTVSDSLGKFELEVKADLLNDTLRVSSIGYKTLTMVTSDFVKNLNINSLISLVPDITKLNEVVLMAKELKEKVVGNETESKKISIGFNEILLGHEIGTKIKISKSPTYIKSFHTNIVTNTSKILKYRLNIYSIKKGLPDKKVVNEDIIFPINVDKGGFTLNLEKYHIMVEDDIFCTIELIETPNVEDDIMFSAALFGNSMVVRTTSHGEWEKVNVVGVGFNCTVKQ